MKAYILSIAGIILISAVITIIMPSGKMGKFVKGTVQLFILVVMLAPLIGWIREGELTLEQGAIIGNDTGYLSRCAEILEERDEAEITAYILENFDISATVDVKRRESAMFDREKITANLTEDGINDEDERINIMTRIQEALEERYGCAAEVM